MPVLQRSLRSQAPRSAILIRLLVGTVFLSEGIQKFLFSTELGVGRFIKIGIPAPQVLAPVVGFFECLCGLLLIIGLFTRLSAVPLLVIISVAIATTKLPMLSGGHFWAMAHEARADYCMLMGLLFLLIVGAGPLSVDKLLVQRHKKEAP